MYRIICMETPWIIRISLNLSFELSRGGIDNLDDHRSSTIQRTRKLYLEYYLRYYEIIPIQSRVHVEYRNKSGQNMAKKVKVLLAIRQSKIVIFGTRNKYHCHISEHVRMT